MTRGFWIMQQRNSKFEVSIIKKGLVNDRKGRFFKLAFSFFINNVRDSETSNHGVKTAKTDFTIL